MTPTIPIVEHLVLGDDGYVEGHPIAATGGYL
jgi:hypothetical protein